MSLRLSEPASTRMWVKTDEGKWFQTSWTEEGVLQCKAAGGWFKVGGHSFVDERVASIAYSKDGVAVVKAPRQPRSALAALYGRKPLPPATAEEMLAELGEIDVDPRQSDLVEELSLKD